MQLPVITGSLMDLCTHWKSILDPILRMPMIGVTILPNIQLQSCVNVINTRLGQQQQGWFIVDQQGPANIYRSAPFNSLTLQLTSSAAVTVSIGVF